MTIGWTLTWTIKFERVVTKAQFNNCQNHQTGRDELMWVAIHVCMEAALRISLHSYFYLKFIITYVFTSTKSENKKVNRFCPEVRRRQQTIYTHMSKCKNDKI
jgi:hypothetical protein